MPTPRPARLRVVIGVLATLLASGCTDWFGASEPPPLPGTRISILLGADAPEPDERVAGLAVRLPPPQVNADWPQQGGFANHAMQHLALPDTIAVRWQVSIGSGANGEAWLTSGPIVADGRVYVMDTQARVSAFAIADGKQLWSSDLLQKEDRQGGWGGGLAYAQGGLYATTGFARVFSLDPATGKTIWRAVAPGPIRAAPTVADGRVFAVTIDNRMVAYAAADGTLGWTHTGIVEAAGVLGGASPAVLRDAVIAPYSSGELFALRAQNGRAMWSDTLASVRRVNAVSALADIRGRPVIDGERVYAISHSGRMAAIDLRTGARAWDLELAGTEQPWVAGDFLYVLTSDAAVVCVTARDGLKRWVTPLRLFQDEAAKTGRIRWTGPVLAGDRLIVAGSNGEILSLSPYTGKILGRVNASDSVTAPLAVAGNSLYVLTDGGRLLAMR